MFAENFLSRIVGVAWSDDDDGGGDPVDPPDEPNLINVTCSTQRVNIESFSQSGFALRPDGSYHTSANAAGEFYNHYDVAGTRFDIQRTVTYYYDDDSIKQETSSSSGSGNVSESVSVYTYTHVEEDKNYTSKWVNSYNDATGILTRTYSLTGSNMPEWFQEYSYSLTSQIITPC